MRLLAALFLALAAPAWAQFAGQQRITFDLIGVNEGLPHAQTDCFLKDRRGNLWVGMQQGLAVYDGTAFIPVDLTSDGAPIAVRSMAEDDDGIIWVAAEQGPVRVDPVSRRADLLRLPDSLRFGIETIWVHAVAVTKPGEVLFGANQGTCFLDTRTLEFRALRNGSGEIVKTFWRFMRADRARQGVWISTHQWGLVFYHTPSGKLYERDGDRSISPMIGEPMVSLCPDEAGGYWCSDRSNGNICHWDGRSRAIRRWDHVPGDPNIKVSRAWYLGRDSQGRIWGNAAQPGGFRFDPNDSSAIVFPTNDVVTGALPHGSINDLYESPNGEIWLANFLGIAIHDPSQPQARFYEPLNTKGRHSTSRIWAMEFMGDSLLWCAMGEDGLVRLDLRSGEVTNVPLVDHLSGPLHVWDVKSDGRRLFVASESDVLALEPGIDRITNLQVQEQAGGPLAPGRRWLSCGDDGMLWVGLNLVEIAEVDPGTGIAYVHRPDSTRAGALRHDNSYCAVSMKDGRVWVSGNLMGLTMYDRRTRAWTNLSEDVKQHRLRVSRIVDMAAASDSVLWLASDGAGLVRYDIPTGKYTHYDQRHGITELGLFSVAIDARGRVWANSDERVFCFDPRKERGMVVGLRSSTGGNAPRWTLGMSRNGMIAMNIGHEVAVFHADAVGSGRIPPRPVLTRLLVDGLPGDVGGTNEVGMHHDNAQLEVHFGAMLPPRSILAYAMRAPDEAWSEYKEGRVILRGLQPGEHAFEFRLMNKEGVWGPATTLHVVIAPPWWQTLWARILFAFSLAIALVLIFRARLDWIRKRERAQEEQARQLNELKLQALRAQMDPHFIFNCLNSIDSFIIASEREQASHYLGRFAKLIRLILQHSDSTRVPLEREVEMLKYYLELEALRFKHPFTFEVRVDEELEGEPVELPTMLVQPYIENAIWHGLRHKDSSGHITVEFRLHADDLECVVEDNGVGRAASRAINQQRSGVHKSMGMRVSADRLRLYGELEQGASRVVVEDLRDADGRASGTRVTIAIPLMGKENEQ